ncbi:MAG: ComF family protein [Patescibacteria group bacterium]
MDMAKYLEQTLLPSYCVNCKKDTPEEPESLRWLCLDCHRLLSPRWQKSPLKPELDESFYLFDYQKDKLAKKLIHALKYNWVKEIAETLNVAVEKERANIKKMMFDVIVPVPLHPRRLRERGFNQSVLIAEKISEITEKPIADNLIKRKTYRRPQMEIKNRESRIKNIQNIFESAQNRILHNKTILLVDDVATTGATLKECARVLKNSCASKVLSFTLAQD